MITGTVDLANADLGLKTSQWVIASDAYIADDHGDLAVVIHNLATNVHPPLDSSDVHQMVSPLALISGSPAGPAIVEEAESAVVNRIQSVILERLGLVADFRRASISDGGRDPDEDDAVTAELLETMTSWLELLGMPDDTALAETLLRAPVPVLGSPPEDWKGLAELIKSSAPSPFVIAAGWSMWGDRPVLALISGGTGLVIWFGKPLAETVREHLVRTLKSRLENDDQIHDPGGVAQAED